MTTAKPRRSRLQYSLKGLMLLVVVAAIPCGLLKWKMDRKTRERAAVAEIRKLNGEFVYDWQWGQKKNVPNGPAWLRRLLGEDFFSSVVWVRLDGHKVTDESLVILECLADLHVAFLEGRQITDAGVAHLKGLSRLEYLNISSTGITDSGLSYVRGLTRLETLCMNKTAVTDAGLVNLKGLSVLDRLNLDGTCVTDDGLATLKGLKRLEWLWVDTTGVTDDGEANLQKALPDCRIIRGGEGF